MKRFVICNLLLVICSMTFAQREAGDVRRGNREYKGQNYTDAGFENYVQLHRPEDGTWRLVNGNPMMDSWSLLDFECLDMKELEGGLKSTERREFQLTKAVI